jgi:hypothetical protein
MSGLQAPAALDYEELEQEVLARIAEAKLATLATSAGDRVTARTVSVVNDGLEIFFQSADSTTKNQQIAVNPNVALSNGSFRLEGAARDIGRPFEHPFFARVFAEKHADAFKQYSPRPVTRLFAVRPQLATIWKLDPDSGPHEILVDLENRTVRRNPLLSLEEWRGLSAVGG